MEEEGFVFRKCDYSNSNDMSAINDMERISHRYFAFTNVNKPRGGRADNTCVLIADDPRTNRRGIATCSARWKMAWVCGKMRLCGEIFRLRVHADYRRRGLGRMLATKMEEQLVENGVHFVYIIIWIPNPGSEGLFQRLQYKQVYSSKKRMMVVDRLIDQDTSTGNYKVTCMENPHVFLKEQFGHCLLWPSDCSVLKFSVYLVDLPGPGGRQIRGVLWEDSYPLGISLTWPSERLTVFTRRILNIIAPGYVDKPIGLNEKFVVRFVYPILLPPNTELSETAPALRALLKKMAVDSKSHGVGYLVVPIHRQLSQLDDSIVQSGIIPFSNILPDMAHSLSVKVLPGADFEYNDNPEEPIIPNAAEF